jgi:hypothetical protein
MRAVFEKLIDSYSKFCSPPEHLEVDEIMVVFKRSHFQTHTHIPCICTSYIPEKVGINHIGVNQNDIPIRHTGLV